MEPGRLPGRRFAATGWTHEQDNLKLVLEESPQPGSARGQPLARESPRADLPYLAREAGFNRYERIVGFDFAAGVDYWAASSPYWAAVRDTWQGVFADRARFTLLPQVFVEAPTDEVAAQVERTVAEHLR